MLALASRRLGDRTGRLAEAVPAAKALGFSRVFASVPPEDAADAKAVLSRLGVTVGAVASPPLAVPAGAAEAVARAANPAAILRARLVVVDAGGLAVAPFPSAEAAVEALARALFGALSAWPGLTLAVRHAGGEGRLLGASETEWLLDALAKKPFGLFLDPARAKDPLDWAERFGPRTLGVALPLPGDGTGRDRPEGEKAFWSTLRDLVPARAERVLDAGPDAPREAVLDARRFFEESVGW